MPIRFLFLVFFVFLIPSFAQAMVDVRVADEEKPVFAFFKLADRWPDFKYWAKSTPFDDGVSSEEDLKRFYEQERKRLQWGFGTYDLKNDFLPIRVDVDLSLVVRDGRKLVDYRLVGFEEQDLPFFPFPYGTQAIGLVLKDLGRFNGLELSAVDYERISSRFKGAERLRVSLKLRVRPLEADVTAPVVVDGVNFWILSGDTAYFAYELKDPVSGKYERLMSYFAPWFMTESERDLYELLGQ